MGPADNSQTERIRRLKAKTIAQAVANGVRLEGPGSVPDYDALEARKLGQSTNIRQPASTVLVDVPCGCNLTYYVTCCDTNQQRVLIPEGEFIQTPFNIDISGSVGYGDLTVYYVGSGETDVLNPSTDLPYHVTSLPAGTTSVNYVLRCTNNYVIPLTSCIGGSLTPSNDYTFVNDISGYDISLNVVTGTGMSAITRQYKLTNPFGTKDISGANSYTTSNNGHCNNTIDLAFLDNYPGTTVSQVMDMSLTYRFKKSSGPPVDITFNTGTPLTITVNSTLSASRTGVSEWTYYTDCAPGEIC
jgi:hypothetical protein